MNVYVVSCNGYDDCVFSEEYEAIKYCSRMTNEVQKDFYYVTFKLDDCKPMTNKFNVGDYFITKEGKLGKVCNILPKNNYIVAYANDPLAPIYVLAESQMYTNSWLKGK